MILKRRKGVAVWCLKGKNELTAMVNGAMVGENCIFICETNGRRLIQENQAK